MNVRSITASFQLLPSEHARRPCQAFGLHGKYLRENQNSCLIRCLPRLRCQTETSMSRPSQTESTYVQTVPDGSCLCPDFRAFARLSCVYVQTFVRSPDFRSSILHKFPLIKRAKSSLR